MGDYTQTLTRGSLALPGIGGTCPHDGGGLTEINATHDGTHVKARTYVCNGPDGHVWVRETGGDGLNAWRPADATMGRLL